MSYLKFLNLMQAVKDLPAFPVMDALEERILNGLAAQLRPQEVQADREAGLARG
jgi:hypothetical protein